MINKIISEIENQKINLTQWIASFVGILFIRFILESLSSPTSSGIIPSDPYTLIHYSLFFLSVTLITCLIVGYFTDNYKNSSKIVLFGLPLIWLAPIVDIVLSRGNGYKMLYVFDTGKNLVFDFFTFFGPNPTYGVTYGMRLGIALSIMGIGYYIYLKNKNFLKTILAVVVLYSVIFFIGSAPGVFYTISHINNPTSTSVDVVRYFEKIITNSTITHNTLREGIYSVSYSRFIELGFNKLLSQILLIFSIIFAGILFWKIDKNKFLAVIKNCRIERVNFYTASLLSGMGFAYINLLGSKFIWADLFGMSCLILAWIALWMHAVHANDIVDIDIDKISNQQRPLVQKTVEAGDMRDTGNVWLSIGLLGAWCAGFYPFFMALVYIAASYIYSSYPLRLRRIPLVPSFLIATACLATVLSGFFFVSTNKQIDTFPIFLSFGILIMVTLAINFKDIKDIEGDKANGILTIPTLFGERGVKIVGIFLSLSILLIPFFLSFYILYIIMIPASIFGYKIATKKPYREKPVFVLRFVVLFSVAVAYLLIYFF